MTTPPTPTRAERIISQLREGFATEQVELIDDSHLHAGHAGARDGRGHFRVRIVSAAFEGLGTLQRHQRVYACLGELMQTDIHALSISAQTPAQAGQGS